MSQLDSKSLNRDLLRDLMVKAFSMAEMEELCLTLGGDSHEIISSKAISLDSFAMQIVLYFGRRGRLDELIKLCKEKRHKIDWEGVYYVDTQLSDARRIQQLRDDLQRDEVLPYVDEFRERLHSFRESLLKCMDYKHLHDHLHKLQYVYLAKIKLAARNMRRKHTDESLKQLERELEYSLLDLSAISQRPTFAQRNMHLFQTRLEQTRTAVHHAIENNGNGAADLKLALELLSGYLDIQLTQVSQSLRSEAERLHNQVSLWKTIEAIRDLVAQNIHNRGLIENLNEGVRTLEAMRDKRDNKIEEHELWQQLHEELMPIRRKPEDYLVPGTYSWMRLNQLNEQVLNMRFDPGMRKYKARWDSLAPAVAQADRTHIVNTFNAYSDEMEMRFYFVDSELTGIFSEQTHLLPLLEGLLEKINERVI